MKKTKQQTTPARQGRGFSPKPLQSFVEATQARASAEKPGKRTPAPAMPASGSEPTP